MVLAPGKDKKGDKLSGPAYAFANLTAAEAKNIKNLAFYSAATAPASGVHCQRGLRKGRLATGLWLK